MMSCRKTKTITQKHQSINVIGTELGMKKFHCSTQVATNNVTKVTRTIRNFFTLKITDPATFLAFITTWHISYFRAKYHTMEVSLNTGAQTEYTQYLLIFY